MDKVHIHGIAFSTYTRTARMAAIQKNIQHELVPIEYGQPSHFALHPFGKMPILTHADLTLYETLAIVGYLDDLSDAPSLFGTGAAQKAQILGAITIAIDYTYRPVVHIKTENGVATRDDLDAAAKPLDWLETQLEAHAHVVGNEITAADLFFAPMLAYHAGQVGEAATYSNRPRTGAWMAAMAERESFASTGA